MRIWLCNDCFETIPGTPVLWNDLQRWFGARDMTGGYTPFPLLAEKIEAAANAEGAPDLIIRNASYFRRLWLPCPTIALVQDIPPDPDFRDSQAEVSNSSNMVVFNSEYTAKRCVHVHGPPLRVIPLSVDPATYYPLNLPQEGYVLWCGWNHERKGADRLYELIEALPDRQFVALSRDDLPAHPRLRTEIRVPATRVVEVMSSARVMVITSRVDTQNLAGIEAGLCGVPVIATNVGAFRNRPPGVWGAVADWPNLVEVVRYELTFPLRRRGAIRDYWMAAGFSPRECQSGWQEAIETVTRERER